MKSEITTTTTTTTSSLLISLLIIYIRPDTGGPQGLERLCRRLPLSGKCGWSGSGLERECPFWALGRNPFLMIRIINILQIWNSQC